ncbi:hypothetical protein AK812_SmicGene39077 [Symbiodinium microadriaticum]|uniref:Uncharacterized protein n=1 Tax=Symbiodinium microadriaticum TaxID=2951 RepID=A0A1Q9CCE3_SYMMI|nr:hypothetical protein AK812_SmicGene39077 [Symbiodinium microadriaticum]
MIRRYGLQKHRGNDFYKQLAASLLNQLATPSQEKEEYLAAILSCIDSFFNGPFQACINKDETAGEQLQLLGRKYLKRFQVLERFRARLPSGSVELLSVAAYRVMTAVEGKADAATLQEVNKESRADTKERLQQQSHLLGQAFLTIYEETAQQQDAKKEDTQQLTYIQVELSKAGVGKLLVKVMELLQSRGPDGEAKVNKVVQFGLHDAMSSSDDDTGMWESFHEAVDAIQARPALLVEDDLRKSFGRLWKLGDLLEAVRMLVEGQFKSMQDTVFSSLDSSGLMCKFARADYLYSQEGNVRSFNVKFVVVLLTELAQGPGLELVGTDEKSQSRTAWTSTEEFLSNMGLIELVSVPLDFEYIRVACRSS